MKHVQNWLDYEFQYGVYQQFSILTRGRGFNTGSIMSVSHWLYCIFSIYSSFTDNANINIGDALVFNTSSLKRFQHWIDQDINHTGDEDLPYLYHMGDKMCHMVTLLLPYDVIWQLSRLWGYHIPRFSNILRKCMLPYFQEHVYGNITYNKSVLYDNFTI